MPDIYGADLAMDLEEALVLVMQGMAGKAPRVNATNNHWEVYDNDTQSWVDTGVNATGAAGADGADGHSPYINNTGYWVFWNDSTGAWVTTNYKAAGRDGEDGHSPYIGANGHWFAWSENLAMFDDTGVPAQGPQGETGATGATGTDGYSPVVTITNITGGHRVTITDEDHPTGQSFDVMDGQDGSGGSGDFVLLRMDLDGYVYNGTTAITGAQINALAATKKAVFLWDEDNDRLFTYTEPEPSTDNALFVMPVGNGCQVVIVNSADNEASWYERVVLPIVTAADNGKFLRVVNGAWAAAEVPAAESNSFGGGA